MDRNNDVQPVEDWNLTDSPAARLIAAFQADDCQAVGDLLTEHPSFAGKLNEGVFPYNMPPLAAAQSKEMVDLLVAHGAHLDAVSDWWQPGFFVERVKHETARYLVELGAAVSIHAAAGLGLVEILRDLLAKDPDQARQPGGDGAHPLHFARDVEVVDLLLAFGADPDARDEDHDSTPAQWRIGDSPEVVRRLLEAGATPDLYLAVGLGDLDLAKQLVSDNPSCTAHRIGNNKGPFPGIGFQGRGGTIYQWTLGFNLSPHEVAHRRGHAELFDFLLQHSTDTTRFLVACTMANRKLATELRDQDPAIISELDEEDLALMAKYCWETNKNIEAVRLMLDLGFPITAREFNHGCTALHNAAWCGDPELVGLLIERGHQTDIRDPDFDSTPIGWAVHSCVEAKRHPNGRFGEVVQLLLANGTPFDSQHYPVGDADIDAVLKEHLGI